MHFHQWGRWEDAGIKDRDLTSEEDFFHGGIIRVRQVITQQRRCSSCNMVKTRYSA